MDFASPVFRVQQSAARLLDRRCHLGTAATLSRDQLGCRHGEHSLEPSRRLTLTIALPRRWVTSDDVFADIGCGKGEIVVQAAHYPFKRVIGVERFDKLAAIARANLTKATHVRAKETEVFTADAATWRPPDDLTVVCLCNSIQGEFFRAMLRQLKRLVDRRGHPLRIIYINPVEHQILLDEPQVSELEPPPEFLMRLTGHPRRHIRRYLLSPREKPRQTLRAITGFHTGTDADDRGVACGWRRLGSGFTAGIPQPPALIGESQPR